MNWQELTNRVVAHVIAGLVLALIFLMVAEKHGIVLAH